MHHLSLHQMHLQQALLNLSSMAPHLSRTSLINNFCNSCSVQGRRPKALVTGGKATNILRSPSQNRMIRCGESSKGENVGQCYDPTSTDQTNSMGAIRHMLLTDEVLQYAVLPEAALGADRYLFSLTTISDVEVSSDLQVVKVYVSVFGDERGKEVAIAELKAKAKYVRSELGRRMKLRLTPEIRFIEDESLERGSRVIAILDRIKNEKKPAEDQDEEQSESSEPPQDDRDLDVDDPDDGIIYVK